MPAPPGSEGTLMSALGDLIGPRLAQRLIEAGFLDWPSPRPHTECARLWVHDLLPAIADAGMAEERLAAAIARYKAAVDREKDAAGMAPREDLPTP